MDFGIIAQAGLTQREFAELCGVTRTTVNLWTTGKMEPHRFIKDSVEAQLEGVARSVAEGTLPLPNSKKGDRMAAVRAAVAQTASV